MPKNLPTFGAIIQGGYFHGVFQIGQELWGEVTAPKASGQITDKAWLDQYADVPGAASDFDGAAVPGATSDFDGAANTQAMLDAGSPLAQAVRALDIDGFTDWYLPARGGLLMQYSNLKPLLPTDDAFAEKWHWSSTQFSRSYACSQYFDYGYADYGSKDWAGGFARAVRRFRIE